MSVPYAEVIGDPIRHSKSPVIHKFWLHKLGLDYDFRLTRVSADEVGSILEGRRADPHWCGCSVTLPNKQAVIPHLTELERDARTIGAVNCIMRRGRDQTRLVGSNTDWLGFLEPLRPWLDLDRRCKVAHVIGTGGAAAAISYALVGAGFTIVSLARNTAKALELRRRLELFDDDLVATLSEFRWSGSEDRSDRIDLLVNATPLGMDGFPPLPLSLDGMPSDVIVYDLVYHPLETELLRSARARGMVAIDGLSMLIGQAARAFQLFFGEDAPRQYDAELRELLTS